MWNPAGRRPSFAVVVLGAAVLVVACGGKSKKEPTTVAGIDDSDEIAVPRVDPSLCDTQGKKVLTYDLNGDDRPDVWKLYATVEEGGTMLEVMTCKQADLDHDGNKDYVVTYSRTGEILAEEFDFTFEGSFDAREHYDKKTGRIYLIERDSDHDKKPDVWEKYDPRGQLESVRRDRNGDGAPDYWEQYKDGALVAILYDDDFDNRVDRKDETAVPGEEPSEEAEAPADENAAPEDEELPAEEG